jgi:uncharacterized repeat protein (TIGR01451 family)
VDLPPAPGGSTHTNNVALDFTDVVGYDYPPITAQDIDNVVDNGGGNPGGGNPGGGNTGGGNTSGGGTNTSGGVSSSQSTDGNIAIAKRVDQPFAGPGSTLTYTVVATNVGSSDLTGRITDPLPDGLRPISASASAGQALISGNTVTVVGATLAPGDSVSITITVQIDPSMSVPFEMVNTACITDTNVCASATTLSVSALPQTGESPWSDVRTLILSVIVGLSVSMVSGVMMMRRRPQQV